LHFSLSRCSWRTPLRHHSAPARLTGRGKGFSIDLHRQNCILNAHSSLRLPRCGAVVRVGRQCTTGRSGWRSGTRSWLKREILSQVLVPWRHKNSVIRRQARPVVTPQLIIGHRHYIMGPQHTVLNR
jgi:hypothetical protein